MKKRFSQNYFTKESYRNTYEFTEQENRLILDGFPVL